MQSMTGFGAGRAGDARGEVRVALSAVNNRGWQLSLKSELGDLALDDELKTTLRTTLLRGSVAAHIQVFTAASGMIDQRSLRLAWRELADLAREVGAPAPALEQVARLIPQRQTSIAWGDLARPALQQAIAALQQTRSTEGTALGTALRQHAVKLRDLHQRMRERAVARMPAYRESLLKRLQEVLSEVVQPEQVVRELAIHAERIDVTEELVRLDAHLAALDGLLTGHDEVGRKLEFLAQEIGREVNTTGAKANDAQLTALVLEAKLVVDHLKEQAANLA
jgi:uncharacterized protein YicC (UPF0701 family)